MNRYKHHYTDPSKLYLFVFRTEDGWINVQRYNHETTDWDDIGNNYCDTEFPEQFIEDICGAHGEDIAHEYELALNEAEIDPSMMD